jgi:polyketide biosynthesis acyl carrier protein
MQEERVLAVVQRHLLAVLPDLDPAAISTARSLADLGCNSLDRAEVVTLAMEDLGVTVPVHEFGGVADLASLVELLRKHLG